MIDPERFKETFPWMIYPSVGKGWHPLLWALCEELAGMGLPEGFRVVQVKEKFGGLRFYVSGATREIRDVIDRAEACSYTVCERCGEPGTVRSNRSWILTLCDACAEGDS